MLAGAFALATLLLAAAVGILLVFRERGGEPVDANQTAGGSRNGGSGAGDAGGRDDAGAAGSVDQAFEPSLSSDELDFRRETLARYLLVVRSDGAAGPKSATGILADVSGSVAVPLSTVRGAEVVQISPALARRNERPDAGEPSFGAVAVDREADWALIAALPLPGAPVAALPRAFDATPETGDRLIVAGASERGEAQLFECEVRDTVSATDIDATAKRALASRGWNVERFDWRRVGPVGAALRPGAGVFSLDGTWLGVVATRTPDGKELLVATGPELSSMFDAVGPATAGFLRLDAPADPALAEVDPAGGGAGDFAATDPSTDDPAASLPSEGATGSGAPMPEELVEGSPFPLDPPEGALSPDEATWNAAAQELSELSSRLEANGLYADSLEKYLDLSDLAENLTTNGQRLSSTPESAARLAWEAERDRALELLATRPWEKDFAAAAHNEIAGTHVDAVKGIFLYGEVTASKDEISATGEAQPILFQAIGRSDRYVVDMTKNADEFMKGSKWIVVGVADPLHKINLRTSADDPGTVVPILEAKYVIGKPDEATKTPREEPAP